MRTDRTKHNWSKLLWKFYHKSFPAWKICIFEFDWSWLSGEVGGVEDDLSTGVEAGHVLQTGVGGGDVGDDHVSVAAVEGPLEEDQTIVPHEVNFVVVNVVRGAVTVRVTSFKVSIHKNWN